MIEYKTAVLVAAALKMGGIVANASLKDQNSIYEFGRNLGIAFQLQDDYLDAFGDPKTFGKQVGGDIIENKKTFLYLKALEKGTPMQRKELFDLFSIQPKDPSDKIKTIKALFVETGSAALTKKEIEAFTKKAFAVLEGLKITEDKKELLKVFGENLMRRKV
jgi:geranylgeranyl diphosphate synthase type II